MILLENIGNSFLPRRAGLALGSLVDVRGRGCLRLIFTLEAVDGDVVADDVLVDIDAIVEHAGAALKTTGRLVVRTNDLVGGGDHLVC